jgi:N-acetylmuramoyl-L-alanine amidase
VECGFLSNADDEQLLITANYQKAIAYAIFKGAVAFYG